MNRASSLKTKKRNVFTAQTSERDHEQFDVLLQSPLEGPVPTRHVRFTPLDDLRSKDFVNVILKDVHIVTSRWIIL